jgi:hypothetical protein
MKKMVVVFTALIFVVMSWIYLPTFSYGQVDWKITRQFNLKSSPLDLGRSDDGKTIYILAPGEVLIYSEDRLVTSIPVEKDFDRLFYSEQDKSLTITSSSKKILKVIQLEFVNKFDISGLPFKGPKDAPVVITVFSDYQ